jgi:hypothetical protein
MHKSAVFIILILLSGCGSDKPPPPPPPPPINQAWAEAVRNEVTRQLEEDPGYAAVVKTALLADHAYNTISDAPIDSIRQDSTEIGSMVTAARDSYRRLQSFDPARLPAIETDCNGNPGNIKGRVSLYNLDFDYDSLDESESAQFHCITHFGR